MHPKKEPLIPPKKGKMFRTFLKVGTFTIGGGYAMIPILQKAFVEQLGWMEEGEFIDGIALSQSVPGGLAVNLSLYIGFRLFGLSGALIGLLGAVLPSLLIMTGIEALYGLVKEQFAMFERIFSGVGPMVTGIIFAAAVGMLRDVRAGWPSLLMLVGAIVLVGTGWVSPVWVILGGGLLGMVFFRKEEA